MRILDLSDEFRRRFDRKMAARERALPASRRSIRASANAIRAIHRGELDEAHRLMEASRAALMEGRDALASEPDVYHAGFHQDAQKEYAEARLTEAIVTGSDLPSIDELDVDIAPYLNGMSESIGEGRRAILDLLRKGEVERSEQILSAMDDMYFLLVSMDYPDAITGNLRRSTDVARGILERTRGDLSTAIVQRDLQRSLERLAGQIRDDLRAGPGRPGSP
ncbi:MAG TPA: haloacid dehalogenase [Actinomycetota bacterium]|nr:haloacid dehalogenase [Actinomycetota bacterium]